MVKPGDSSKASSFAPDGIPVTSKTLQAPPKWAVPAAREEVRKWPELDEIKLANNKRWLIVYGWVLVSITVVFTAIFLAAFIGWSMHYLTPWSWLEDHQIDKIQSILFSGGMGAIVTNLIRSQISKF